MAKSLMLILYLFQTGMRNLTHFLQVLLRYSRNDNERCIFMVSIIYFRVRNNSIGTEENKLW